MTSLSKSLPWFIFPPTPVPPSLLQSPFHLSFVCTVLLRWGWLYPQETLGNIWRHFWLPQLIWGLGVLLASSRWRSKVLANILQCRGHLPKIIKSEMSVVSRLGNAALWSVNKYANYQSTCLQNMASSKVKNMVTKTHRSWPAGL